MTQAIHIFGASGSGTTSLGQALSEELQIPHLDTDDYYWKQTDPPFVEKHEPSDRIRMIERDTAGHEAWVLSGSVCSWGGPLVGHFALAVFLRLAPSIRMARLHARERQRHGTRIDPRGDMHRQHVEFMNWAQSYDTASAPIRSLDLHEQWMQRLDCPILRLDSNESIATLATQIENHIAPKILLDR
jgi:adenylate kinase family enzyme